MEHLPGAARRLSAIAALTLASAFALLAPTVAAATPAHVGPSNSIDALGDSITRGYDSQGTGCGTLADCPANSWATGTNAGVNSYYTRLKAINPSVVLAQPVKTSTTGGNDAVTGAKMSGLPGQATNAVKAPNTPDQVMILMGANDVCTSTEANMTSVASFRSSYKEGLEILSKGLPDARIDVSSIPNIFQLWSTLHENKSAQTIWTLGSICQSMLKSPTSEAAADKERRAKVKLRNEEFNAALGEVCAEFIHCQYDQGAAFAIKFAASNVGTIDYFHPNTSGQAIAAENAWNTGPNFTDLTTPTTSITPDREPDSAAGWYDHDVQVSLSASDLEYAVAGTEYRINNAAAWKRYTGPITLGEGVTSVEARSVDVNGNIEESRTATFKVDATAPATPSVGADRAPDYEGDGGWYKDSVTVTFSDDGDPLLGDGSPGSGVDPGSVPSPQVFDTDGSHTATGAVRDYAGNESGSASLEVQVDATPPAVEVSCPAFVFVGTPNVRATVTAADAQSGLAVDPSGVVPIDTSAAGPQTVERTAEDNVGHQTTASCTTAVGYTQVLSGTLRKKVVVKAGQAIELSPGTHAKGVEVQPGGRLDVDGASAKSIKSVGAWRVHICGSSVSGGLTVTQAIGPVTVGDPAEGCAPNSLRTAMLSTNGGGVSVLGNTIAQRLSVLGNGGAVVTGNTVGGNLTVLGNVGTVVDSPNSVGAKSKLQ
jgi:lysophospholipase L1-like esterase